jgi:hypothetical protein
MAIQSKRLSHNHRFQLSNWLNECLTKKRKFANMTVVATTAEKELKFPVSKSSIEYIIKQLEWNTKDFVSHVGMPSTKTTHKVIALEKKVNELSNQLQVMTLMLERFMKDSQSPGQIGDYEYYRDYATTHIRMIREDQEARNISDTSLNHTTNGAI